ncbi:hypothetical protein NQ317_013415 [Molorchus minor]|uniref:Uncharacterized protein n=1 Tax=Molorchus minor TaxID=1323400 RepID=A0ABQ9JUE9_9CUCU|nr:hypothetical protein NQ317_013415 [Molorchus minor]
MHPITECSQSSSGIRHVTKISIDTYFQTQTPKQMNIVQAFTSLSAINQPTLAGIFDCDLGQEGDKSYNKAMEFGSTSGIKFRQLTDGKHFIQLIYDEDDQLRDCEFGHQKDQIKSFYLILRTGLEYPRLRDLCHKKHREIKRMVQVVQRGGQKPECNK